MDTIFNYNGTIGPLNNIGFNPYNRAFKYGDGIIETIRVYNSRPLFIIHHIERLTKSAAFLGFELGKVNFEKEIIKLLKETKVTNGRIRLEIFRTGNGAYIPENNEIDFLIEIKQLDYEPFELNKTGLTVDIYRGYKKMVNSLSFIKSCNASFYILAGLFAKSKRLKTCLLLNSNDYLIEGLYSNLFIVKHKIIYTPTIESGCIEGTMRKTILEIAFKLNYKVKEQPLVELNLLEADEVFLTNAVIGVEWVGAYKKKRYYNVVAKKLSNELKKVSLN